MQLLQLYLVFGCWLLVVASCANSVDGDISKKSSNEQSGLTNVSYNALLEVPKSSCTNENWNAGKIKINAPINITVKKDSGRFNIRSFCMFDVDDIKVVADLGGKEIVLANVSAKPFDDNEFKIKLFTEDGFYLVDGKKTFVSKDKYTALDNFRLKIENEKYKKIRAIDVGWYMDIQDYFQGADIRSGMTKDRIKASLMAHTNLAYTLASYEFDQIVRHIESLIGRKLYKHEKILGMANASASSFNPAGKTERPIEECGWVFSSEDVYKEFFDIMGVRCETYSGRKLTTFGWGLGGYGNRHGVTNDFAGWDSNHIGGGRRYKVDIDAFIANAEYSLDLVSLHEIGHVWGYNHACDFCSGIMDMQIIPVLTDLMQTSGKAPYTEELAPYKGSPRCGFNKVEKFIYDHRGDWFSKSDLPAYMDKIKSERNAGYETVSKKIKSATSSMPPPLAAVWANSEAGKAAIKGFLHLRDIDIFSAYGTIDGVFFKIN